MEDLIEAYLSVYEESDVAKRTREAVGHQRKGTHGDDHEMERESEESTKAVKKATRHKGPKVTPSLPESYDEFDEGFKRMNRDKIERQAKKLGGDRGDVLRDVADRMDTEAERKYSTSQARKNRAGAGSEYRKAQELRARDDAKADFKKYGLPESVDLYDVVLDHLLNEGYADTEENALTIMANMSEEWRQSIVGDIDEGYKNLPVGKMMRKVFSKGYKKGRQDQNDPSDQKEKGRGTFGNVVRMLDVAQEHDPEVSKEKERQNRIRGRAKG